GLEPRLLVPLPENLVAARLAADHRGAVDPGERRIRRVDADELGEQLDGVVAERVDSRLNRLDHTAPGRRLWIEGAPPAGRAAASRATCGRATRGGSSGRRAPRPTAPRRQSRRASRPAGRAERR